MNTRVTVGHLIPGKECTRCHKLKALSDFNPRKEKDRREGLLRADCRQCQNVRNKRYSRTADGPGARKRRRFHAEVKDYIAACKDVPCVDCGGRFPTEVMDFDHLPGTTKEVQVGKAALFFRGKMDKVMEEIAKCEIVCANCHRIRTHARRLLAKASKDGG